jgi:ubiquinone/menaquinone biosynthesis C-methylase UbiE
MPDIYSDIARAERSVPEQLADTMEARAAHPEQQEIFADYLRNMPLSPGSRVLEAGCGTGAHCRGLAAIPNVGQVVGLDPSPVFLERARQLTGSSSKLIFTPGDCRAMPFPDRSFDAVFFHTVLSHVPEPERALSEALRVLKPEGHVSVFDGDYISMTIAGGPNDPLQACCDAIREVLVHDPWFGRRLPLLMASTGFEIVRWKTYTHSDLKGGAYFISLVDRGADVLVSKVPYFTRNVIQSVKLIAQSKAVQAESQSLQARDLAASD